MTNTSATGGVLTPATSPAPLEGAALLAFIQGWIVGLTGMDGKLVRPRWQPEAPVIPDEGTAWAAIGLGTRSSDTYPFVGNKTPDGSPGYSLARQEEIPVLCSFYDLGSGGQADALAALLRDQTAIAQNRELLRANNFAFVSCGELTPVPSLLKTRWLYRVDVPITLRRQINRSYPVLLVETADIDLKANNAGDGIYEQTITVQP